MTFDDFAYGKYLFHYTRRDRAFARIVPDGQLRFSPLDRLRDPLENKPWTLGVAQYGGEVNNGVGLRARLAAGWALNTLANSVRTRARILAFTHDAPGYEDFAAFGRGWARASMWEHYAENHLGVCLVFDKERAVSAIGSSLHAALGV